MSTASRKRSIPALAACVLSVTLAVSCKRESGEPAGDESEGGHGAAGGHEGHAAAEGGEEESGADMDVPVDELLERECEHGVKTYTCDECRYEVGVVEVPEQLMKDGVISVGTVEAMSLDDPLKLTAEIRTNDSRTAHIAPRVTGTVKRVFADLGQEVEAGDVLLEIESVEVGEAGAAYLEAASALKVARKAFERQEKLVAAGVTSDRDFQEAKLAWQAAAIALEVTRKKLLLLGVAPGQMGKAGKGKGFGLLPITSPIAGKVIDMHAPQGETIEAGTHVLTVSDLSTLWAWADVYESDLSTVLDHWKAGTARASISVSAFPGEAFHAELDMVGDVMDESARTVKIRLLVPNEDGRLRPGMFGAVSLIMVEEGGVPALPASALMSDEGQEFVFVRLEGDYWIRRRVTVGRRTASWIEVLDGVLSGQEIVVEGAFLLKSDVLRSKMGAGCAD